MAVTQTRGDFHAISAVSFQHKKDESTVEAYSAYCTGQYSAESETREITKTCRGVVTHKKTKVIGMTATVNLYAPVELVRAWFGLSNEGLKAGVYSYGTDSAAGDFALVFKLEDEFEEKSKMVAFPNVTASTGYEVTIDNDADEVAKIEFQASVQPDEKGKFYYEADEVTSSDEETWLSQFAPALVEAPSIP